MNRNQEVYWITGGSYSASSSPAKGIPPGLAASLVQSGIRLEWVEEAHWFFEAAAEKRDERDLLAGFDADTPIFSWESSATGDHYHLQACCRTILSGARQAIVIGNVNAMAVDFMLLASPRFVGRYNVVPHAHLRASHVLPGRQDALCEALVQQLENEGVDLENVGCLHLHSPDRRLMEACQAVLPGVQINAHDLASGHSFSVVFNAFMASLPENEHHLGLILSQAGSSPAVLSLAERI